MPVKQESKTQVVIPCTVFSRVVGYYSATDGWNKGKRQEFKERETYKQHGRIDDAGPTMAR